MKIKLLFIAILFTITQSVFSKTLDYSKMAIKELKIAKEKAITGEDYSLAQKIKSEIESRKTLDEIKNQIKSDLQVAINEEDFEEAGRLKEKLKKIDGIV